MQTIQTDTTTQTPVPTFTITFNSDLGPQTRAGRTAGQVETFGTILNRVAARGQAWDIVVLDADGQDVTFDFACFQA